ncbi:MAG TPA: hypothetical protein PLP42_18865 [Acidobacteriota bacterium]|nr:hypothetical protein [Acidobacteriota bacterium]
MQAPRYVFPAPELLNQIEVVLKVLEAIEKADLPELVQRRCRFFIQEYLLPEMENFLNLAHAIAATAPGSDDEAKVLQSFGISVELGVIRRNSRTKVLSQSDQEFLRSMNIRW